MFRVGGPGGSGDNDAFIMYSETAGLMISSSMFALKDGGDGSTLSVNQITAKQGTIAGFDIANQSLTSDNILEKFVTGTSPTSHTLTHGTGVFIRGDGKFRVGNADDQRITFDGTNILVQAATVSGSVVRSSGDVVAFYTSDERLKDNIKTIDKPIHKIKKLKGVEYEWNDKQDVYPSGSLDSGIIAQDVEKVLPQLVKKGKGDYLGVRHDRLVGLLIEAVKEQQNQIDEMKEQIKELKDGSS